MVSIPGLLRSGRSVSPGVFQHIVGNATVLHTMEAISPEAQSLALTVVADSDNDIVVLDVGEGVPIGTWEAMAAALPRRRRGIRLIICGRQQSVAAMAGQWLSERLHRRVVAPDGELVRGAAGILFVNALPESGWVRFQPGKPSSWEAKRYPAPQWDRAATDRRTVSSTGEIEPLPGGVWIHDTRDVEAVATHRQLLTTYVPCRPETMTVLLGCPDTGPLSLDDVVRFWRGLDEQSRQSVRFVQYGKVRMPAGETIGQALADLLAEPVVCYTGVPVGSPQNLDIRTIRADGTLGWSPFAWELSYTPRAEPGSEPARPAVLSHRPPLVTSDEVSPRVYWFAPDAVVEVVQAGLWMRAEQDPAGAERLRAVTLNPEAGSLFFDDTVADRRDRMRDLAADLAARLDQQRWTNGVLVAASTVAGSETVSRHSEPAGGVVEVAGPVPVAAPPAAPVVAPAPVVPVAGPLVSVDGPTLPAAVPVLVSGEAPAAAPGPWDRPLPPPPGEWSAPSSAPPAAVPPVPSSASVPLPTMAPVSAASSHPATGTAVLDPAGPPATLPEPLRKPAPPVAEFTEPVTVVTGPVMPVVVPDVVPAPPARESPAPPARESPAPPARESPAPPARESPAVAARLQPVPVFGASALLPDRGLAEERAWLRRTLSRDFDVLASSVSRIMSEHPSLQNNSLSEQDVLADSVAVRLYLTARGTDIDAGLRAGRKGPHVPFARCVVAGLSRMPSFRGTSICRTSPSAAEWELYRGRRLVTDWGFVNALTQPCLSQQGNTDVLIWSMTARRTGLLEPADDTGVEDRVVFLPGTNFKILELREPAGTERGAVLLREIGTNEIGDDGRVDPNRVSLDELAVTSLHRSRERWVNAEPRQRIGAGSLDRLGGLPGLERKG